MSKVGHRTERVKVQAFLITDYYETMTIQISVPRFVTKNYRQTASVTSLIQNQGWTDLETRLTNSRLVSM